MKKSLFVYIGCLVDFAISYMHCVIYLRLINTWLLNIDLFIEYKYKYFSI